MKHRNPFVVVLLSLLTFGIYGLVWSVLTAREMRAQGASIPNSILIIIPVVSLYWLYKYSEGIEKVSGGKYSTLVVFLLWFFTGIGGMIISQIGLNEAAAGGPVSSGASPVAEGAASPAVATPGVTTAATAATVAPVAASSPAPAVAAAPSVEPTPVTPPTVTPEVAAAPETPSTPETVEPTVAYAPLPSASPEPSTETTPSDPSSAPVVPAPEATPEDPNQQA